MQVKALQDLPDRSVREFAAARDHHQAIRQPRHFRQVVD